ncbi:MAG: ATP-dependent helicase [Deltaproteobacteria bacterium]|nr:MAG: ATP-dependent helicase [Deltaproteobacteria bacterium]
MNVTLDMLNENQRQAAKWLNGPLLLLAGPGSGKTAVLTLRIANLIADSADENYRILGLTFTVKAANEMKSRISDLIGENSRRVRLRTFHSFCTDLLRQHGSHLGLHPDFSVITDDKDRIAILKDLKDQNMTGLDDPEDSLKRIDTMFTHGIDAEDLPDYFKEDQQEQCHILQTVFNCYLQELSRGNQLDFGSMLHFSRKLLETMPRIARQIKTVYRYICVDEFQDTNLAQYKILKLAAGTETANLFVVADDDQVIFQWNGADPKRLEELKADYHPKVIQLPENYRCPQEVVEIANRLIKHNPDRTESKKAGISHNREPGIIKVKVFDNFDAEIEGLITEIDAIPENLRETCVIIARSNKLLSQALVALRRREIEAEIVSRHQDFASPPALVMYYSLRLANSPDSRSILNKLCSVATMISGTALSAEDVAAKANVEDLTTLRVFFVLASDSGTLQPFCEIGQKTLCDSLEFLSFIEQSFHYFDTLNNQADTDDIYPDYAEDMENWNRISDDIRREHRDGLSLHVFLQEMDLTPKSKSLSRSCVRLRTVHTAKGTEFDNVFILGLAEDQFPSYFAVKNGTKSIQEERRNCFVAITRSSGNLCLSYAKQYFGWPKKPSRFLKEMGLTDE